MLPTRGSAATEGKITLSNRYLQVSWWQKCQNWNTNDRPLTIMIDLQLLVTAVFNQLIINKNCYQPRNSMFFAKWDILNSRSNMIIFHLANDRGDVKINQIKYEKHALPGLQSVRREQMDSRTLEIVRAGDQLSLRISKHITPWELMLQW